jgi:sulfate transport system substrate-binding protein
MQYAKRFIVTVLVFVLSGLALSAQSAPAPTTLTLAGFAVGREVYGALLEAFRAEWQASTGQTVNVLESYQASGALSRQIEGGFPVDVFTAQLDPEVTRLVTAGLVDEDWKATDGYNGISNVVIVTRKGNPKNVQDWADLAQAGIEVILPNPGTSGGAQWLFLAPIGAVLRDKVEGYSADEAGVEAYLRGFIANVGVFDRDGRESFLTFERGVGDVAVTYENEALKAIEDGGEYEIIYPTSTVIIERPVVIIDENVERVGNRDVAEAFIAFAKSDAGQLIYAQNGYRPLAESTVELPEELAERFPVLEDTFTVDEQFGGWRDARTAYFGDEGLVTLLIAEIAGL